MHDLDEINVPKDYVAPPPRFQVTRCPVRFSNRLALVYNEIRQEGLQDAKEVDFHENSQTILASVCSA